MIETSLKLIDISKSYDGVAALKNVCIELFSGKIYGIVGENGAGKSTLMKVINGAVFPDHGRIIIDEKEVMFHSPSDAQQNGIGMVYQELNLIPDLSIIENVYISCLSTNKAGYINWKYLHKKTMQQLKKLGIDLDPKIKVGELKVAYQQLVAIVRALALNCKVIILDEPTSALPQSDIKRLLEVVEKLKELGYIVIYISHKLDEVIQLADEVIALRNGEKIAALQANEITEKQLTELIAGRDLEKKFPKTKHTSGEEILRFENVSVSDKLQNISFSLHKGEILGFTGLLGAGKTEIAETIFGINDFKNVKGKIYISGKEVKFRNPRSAIRHGIGLVPENRAAEGLILPHSILSNITLASLKMNSVFGYIKKLTEAKSVDHLINSLRIKCRSVDHPVRVLSGGNQQKVVLAKWLAAKSKILIFDEPTRGIDVGAKVEVYNLMNELVKQGIGVIIMSSELDEVKHMSDRVILLSEGKMIKELYSEHVNEEEIYEYLMEAAGE